MEDLDAFLKVIEMDLRGPEPTEEDLKRVPEMKNPLQMGGAPNDIVIETLRKKISVLEKEIARLKK